MNIGVHVSFAIVVFSAYIPNIGIAGSHVGFIPRFMRNLHTVLHSVYQFTLPPTVQEGFHLPHPLQNLLVVYILMVILTDMR